jgi:hypothetical protein
VAVVMTRKTAGEDFGQDRPKFLENVVDAME